LPKTRLRYTQVRRLGTPNVEESDQPYAEGRYFEANCLVSDLVNHCVRVTGVTLGVPNVTRVDPLLAPTMPAIGIVVQKPTSTTCLVQVSGQITSFSPVVAGSWYYVGTAAFPVPAPPAFPAIPQVIGVGLDTARLLLRHGFGIEPASAVDSEVPSGSVNGFNVVFGTAMPFKPGTTRFFLNGVRQRPGLAFDYTEGPGSQTLTLTLAPKSGDQLLVDYVV
jgi:hypothetical protein